MPILKGSASDFTSTVKGSAEVNAAIGGAVARGGNANPPRAAGAVAAIVTQSAIAKTSGLQPTRFRVLASTPAAPVFEELPTSNTLTLGLPVGSRDAFVCRYSVNGRLNWVRRIGGLGDDDLSSITSDRNGNVYVAGLYFSASLTIYNADNTTVFATLTNSFSPWTDGVIIKYNRNGIPQWVRRIAGEGNEEAVGIDTDSLGNVYVTGFYDNIQLNIYDTDGTTILTSLPNTGFQQDAFVIKYNTLGVFQWARRVTGSSAERGVNICVDPNGNVYITGVYSSNPAIVSASNNIAVSASISNEGSIDTFIVKYNTLGTMEWVRKIGAAGNETPYTIYSDLSGSIYVSGSYTSNPVRIYNSDNTTVFASLTSDGGEDTFILKYNTSGVPQWVRRVGGVGTDRITSNSTDSFGNVYLTGIFNSSPMNIYGSDNTTSIASLSNTTGTTDIFIIKFDSSGVFQWMRRLSTTDPDSVNDITTDSSGNIYITGAYPARTLSIFGSDNTNVSASLGFAGTNANMFIIKYNTLGNIVWATRTTGTGTGSISGKSISSDSIDGICVAGFYQSNEPTFRSVGF